MHLTLRTSFALSCIYFAACDSQATPDYLGESMLSLVGSVTIEDDRTQGKLVPALAFENLDDGRLDILDVESRGEFPSSFELDVYTPPLEVSLMNGPPEEPRFALGYITAVAADHEPSIRFSYSQGVGGYCDDEACHEEFEACTPDGSRCYRETRRCDMNLENCVVTQTSGDPSILDDPFRSFAGLSANYRVIYLDSPANAGSELANVFAGGARLDAGYHLLSVRPSTQAELQASVECFTRAEDEVIAAYNEQHGTSVEDINELGEGCADDGTPCESPDSEVIDELFDQVDERIQELGCRGGGDVYTAIGNPGETRISIRIAPNVGPLAGQASASE